MENFEGVPGEPVIGDVVLATEIGRQRQHGICSGRVQTASNQRCQHRETHPRLFTHLTTRALQPMEIVLLGMFPCL